MSVFAPSDVRSVTIPNGCGDPHEAADLPEGERWSVDCPACEPHIMADLYGWAYEPGKVAPTTDERAEIERAEKDAKRANNATWSNPAAMAAMLAQAMQPAQAEAPTLLSQIASLSADDRRALVAMLSATDNPQQERAPAPVAPPVKAVPVKATGRR